MKHPIWKFSLIIAIDNRGSINHPASLLKELGLKNGDHLNISVEEGGIIVLRPMVIYPTVQLSEQGLAKLKEARERGVGVWPSWFSKEIKDAGNDSEQKVSKTLKRSRPKGSS